MNSLQFYYLQEVFNISFVIRPQKNRDLYRLRPLCPKRADLLFFCSTLKTEEEKSLVQKIANSLTFYPVIVEIRDPQNPGARLVLNNLITRFLPKGFVIFGAELANQLREKTNAHKNQTEKISETALISKDRHALIPGLVLNPIRDFTGENQAQTRALKQKAWDILREAFL